MSELEGIWPVKAMNFKTGSRDLLEGLADDPVVCFEQKLDGTRCLILVSGLDDPVPVNRHGEPMKHTAALPTLAAALPALPRSHGTTILDCEVMWAEGKLVIFDIPWARWPLAPAITFETPYAARREALERWATLLADPAGPVRLAAHEREPEGKRKLARQIQGMNGEGVMVKHLAGPYRPGARVGHSLKVKFTKTADVIVTSYELGRNEAGNYSGSIGFGVLPDDGPAFPEPGYSFGLVGSCSAIGRPALVPGQVIEVEYLAYMAGGGLREPRMVRVREDKTPGECRMGQFTEHCKAVL